MKSFMNADFLLETETARYLYHQVAAPLPLVDYHCHIPPRQIYEDQPFEDLGQVWLGGRTPDGACFGDHYKWRLMRADGALEEEVTGGLGYPRFLRFAQALEKAVGNPMVHWCNLELRQYFGVTEPLTPQNARAIWDHCGAKLREDPQMTPRGLIKQSNVVFIGTTDDPADSLEWHEKLAADPTFKVKVCPSFRPDPALDIQKPGFGAYLARLAQRAGTPPLDTVQGVAEALISRLEAFHALGCRVSDHGLAAVPFRPGTPAQADGALAKALGGEPLSQAEAETYQTYLLLALGKAYHRLGIAMQIHYGCLRNVNARMLARLGPDTGYDTVGFAPCLPQIAGLLSALDEAEACPRVILYSLNPGDTAPLASLTGCFQGPEVPGKIQLGSAWWFNDTKSGMEDQLRALANVGLLGNFIGMLTDSRSFLSYPRHGYFRRILCNLVGGWVEKGEVPNDEASLKALIEGICYGNAKRYFQL